jgi:hypothetical protein
VTAVPPEAVTAAAAAHTKAINDLLGRGITRETEEHIARVMLDAALPYLTGRLVLVWRDERGEEITRSTPVQAGACYVAIPIDAQSVDLIEGDQP